MRGILDTERLEGAHETRVVLRPSRVAIPVDRERPDQFLVEIASRDVIAAIPGASVSLLIRTEPGFPAVIAEAAPIALSASNPGQFAVETVADLRGLRFGVSNDLGTFVGRSPSSCWL